MIPHVTATFQFVGYPRPHPLLLGARQRRSHPNHKPGNNSLKPQLGSLGKSLLSESFDAKELPKPWTRNTGTLVIHDGVLEVCEQSSDHHAAAFRYPLPLKDCAIQIDFKMAAHSKMVHLGFDPAPGELKKKGHLFSVAVTQRVGALSNTAIRTTRNPRTKS